MIEKIFLSGTDEVRDLLDALYMALQEYDFEPIWYHRNFPIHSSDSLEECLNNVKLSDRFILVIGKRYGYIYEKTNKSATEEEFWLAYELDKPILVFIRADVYDEYTFYLRYKEVHKIGKKNYTKLFSADREVYDFIYTIENQRNEGILW